MNLDQQDLELIQNRFRVVCERIEAALQRANRRSGDARLVVVTKMQSTEVIQAVVEAGAQRLGENYAEEAIEKMPAFAEHKGLEWHMIGHIQSRKSGLVVQNFDYIHSLDSVRLAERINRQAAEMGKRIPVLVECNSGGEESKFGFPAWQEEQWQALVPEFEKILALPHLEVKGLMAMAPYFDVAELARPHFRKIRKLRDALANWLPGGCWDELSMGMSGDFEVAIEEGATWVRIGQGILGARPLLAR